MILQLLITYIFFSLSLLSVSILMHDFSAASLTAIRLTSSGILLSLIGIFMAQKKTWHQFASIKSLASLAFLSFGNVFCINILLSLALGTTCASLVGLLYNTNPLMVAAFAALIGMERLTQRKVLALVAGFAGLLVIMLPGGSTNCGAMSSGQLFALSAAVVAAIAALVMKKVSNSLDKAGGFLLIGLSMVIGGGIAFFAEPISISLITAHWPMMLFAIVTTSLAAICYYFLLASYPASVVTMASFTTPIFLAIVEFIIYGQVPSYATLVGGSIVLAALWQYLK